MGKNFINKLLPLALTAAMIVPSVPAMAAPSDIAGHWAESVITQWQSKGLIQGYEDGTFKPGNTITRAEFVTLMNVPSFGFWQTALYLQAGKTDPFPLRRQKIDKFSFLPLPRGRSA